jgi:hypothetical protein
VLVLSALVGGSGGCQGRQGGGGLERGGRQDALAASDVGSFDPKRQVCPHLIEGFDTRNRPLSMVGHHMRSRSSCSTWRRGSDD